MPWILTIATIVFAFVAYTMIINSEFVRCPHCGKIGSWRFDDIAPPVDEYDDDDCLIRSSTRQKCRKWAGEVLHIWSDYEGREIRHLTETEQLTREKLRQPQGLVSVVLDRSAPFGDRHDAAMDLSAYDDEIVEDALQEIVSDPTEDADISEEAADSLREIEWRKSTHVE